MNYQESLKYLHELCKFGINLGLERITMLLNLLGNPHRQIAALHIAGTNGKGSTSAMIAGILKEAGLKVGVYTSPHLHSYSERIRINGEDIADHDFAAGMAELKEFVPEVLRLTGENPTEFEILTALAFQYFAKEKVDIMVIEVGMGGRLDSTNVVTPLISVITSISRDHIDYLGPTLADVAREKAGIIKAKVPVISAFQEECVESVLADTARKLASPLYFIKNYKVKQTSFSSRGQIFDLVTETNHYNNLELPLLGDHQLENAVTAVKTVELLQSYGWPVINAHIMRGLKKVKWPGRLEYHALQKHVLFDGAHNPEGAKVLAEAIPKYFHYKKLIMVMGVLEDKDKKDIIKYLGPLGNVFVITKPPNQRAGNWQSLSELLEPYAADIFAEEDFQQAMNIAFDLAAEDDLICITGSLYLLGESRKYVLNTFS
ncbi:MAG: bifunctional folylpolyglutamate synthase/dihydrofolate synthase [Peptococcaceae bacterium]